MERARRAPRLALDTRIGGHAHYWTDIHVVDLSPTGALLESPRYLAPGSDITVELLLGTEPLTVQAHVVHCTADSEPVHRAGVHFAALPSRKRDQIREYLRNNSIQERREQPRIFVGQQAQLKKEIELSVLNLNLFGGLFSANFPLEFRSEYDFVFKLPGGEVRVRGTVRHCEARATADGAAVFRLGVEFTELTGIHRERVCTYLEEQIQGS